MDDLIKEIYSIKQTLSDIEREQVKPLKARKVEIEGELIAQLDELKLSKSGISGVNIGISEAIIPQTTGDWQAFFNFVVENDAYEMLMKSCNNAMYRDALETGIYGESIPGLQSFTKRTLSVTKAK